MSPNFFVEVDFPKKYLMVLLDTRSERKTCPPPTKRGTRLRLVHYVYIIYTYILYHLSRLLANKANPHATLSAAGCPLHRSLKPPRTLTFGASSPRLSSSSLAVLRFVQCNVSISVDTTYTYYCFFISSSDCFSSLWSRLSMFTAPGPHGWHLESAAALPKGELAFRRRPVSLNPVFV